MVIPNTPSFTSQHAAPASAHTGFQQLPLVDISGLFSSRIETRLHTARALDKATRDAGFLYIKGHGISTELVAQLLAVSQRYFAQTTAAKMDQYIGLSNNHSGYVPQGEEGFYSSQTSGQVDLKEGYDIGPESPSLMQPYTPHGATLWPKDPEFKAVVSRYYHAMLELSHLLFRGFALALGVPENTFTQHLSQPPSQLRLLHYFDNPNAKEADQGIGTHTDYEFFTILLPTAPGLQVLNGLGEWIDVPVVDGCFVMNIGDMMELASNGQYVATAHRVQQVTQARYSFPFFASLDYHTQVAPLSSLSPANPDHHYTPLICGDHLLAQTIQTFRYLQSRLSRGEIQLPEQAQPLMSFGQAAAKA